MYMTCQGVIHLFSGIRILPGQYKCLPRPNIYENILTPSIFRDKNIPRGLFAFPVKIVILVCTNILIV